MTRLLFVDQYGGMGGGQRILLSILRAAVRTGGDISVLAPGGGPLQSAIAREFGTQITFIPCEEPPLTHGRKTMADFFVLLLYGWRFRRFRPLLAAQDVIYINGLRHLPHILILTRRLAARLIWHVHIGHSRIEKLLLRRAAQARNTWRLVVNSRFVRNGLNIAPGRICLIENALDASFANRTFVDRFTNDGKWCAAVLGTLRPEKGQDIAVAVAKRRTQIALHLIGPSGNGAEVWLAALKSAAGPNVHFEGAVPDIAAAIDGIGMQFNLVPSRWNEPFGLVAIEGMACSCITIVSGRGGLAEIAERTGALVAADADSLGRILDDLCSQSPASLAAMARAQHRAVQEIYAPARFEAQVRELLQAALKAAPATL